MDLILMNLPLKEMVVAGTSLNDWKYCKPTLGRDWGLISF